MKIYVSHSKKLDYFNGLYLPLRQSRLNDLHEIVLPHEFSDKQFNSKEFLQTCGVMLAEVTLRATGLGIELGWADALGVPIIGLYETGSKVPDSVKKLTNMFVEYSNSAELIAGIELRLSELNQ